jgi:hypothetical protein
MVEISQSNGSLFDESYQLLGSDDSKMTSQIKSNKSIWHKTLISDRGNSELSNDGGKHQHIYFSMLKYLRVKKKSMLTY